ncbi:MAG TPA: glycoside hydrolase family 44 protein [Ktedonobacterales bacterium]|jgi:hypothetical protein
MDERKRQQLYDFGDEMFQEHTPGTTAQQRLTLPTHQGPRRIKRRTLLMGLGAVGGLAVGGIGGYELWSRLLSGNNFQLSGPLTTPNDLVVYTKGKLSSGWQDFSWTKRQLDSQTTPYDNQPSLRMTLDGWGALWLHYGAIDLTDFGYLQFYVNGGAGSDQKVFAFFEKNNTTDADKYTARTLVGSYIEGGSISSNQWRLVRIPLSAMKVSNLTVAGVLLQDATGGHQQDISIADLRLVYAPDTTPPHVIQGVALDLGTITLVFDKRMLPDDAQTTSFYKISSVDPAYVNPQVPLSAHYHLSSQSVSLLVPQPMQASRIYTVTLGPIRDKYNIALGGPAVSTVTAQSLALNIDAGQPGHTISPLIYGMAQAPAAWLQDLRPRINRWGGNQTSRYNWKLGNAFNAARDYEFRNGNYSHQSPADEQPSGVADQFIALNQSVGAETILTIPNIGWVARDDQLDTRSTGVPQTGGPPLSPGGEAINGYDPTQNRQTTSVRAQARKGAPLSDPPDVNNPTVAQDEWVYHLVKRFGTASSGGVRYYAMDNEPDLWFAIHTDIRPAEIGYDQMRDTFLDYATAVKSVDPSAFVTGPVLSGWLGYFYSPLDRGSDNFHTKADHRTHNNQDFLPWWLSEVRKHDEQTGKRTLDMLDIHYYPNGGEYTGPTTDPKLNAQRLRAVRSLWDPTYTDASWVNDKIQLIPRMQQVIQKYYPGTKLGITEWNFGGETHINGALAAAEALGVMGREGVDLACYWAYPPKGSPTYYAWKLFTNFDDQGTFFGGTSVQANSTNADILSCYASFDAAHQQVLVMVLNKSTVADLTPVIHLANSQVTQAQAYQVSEENPQITPLAPVAVSGGTLTMTFPASSITLLRCTR